MRAACATAGVSCPSICSSRAHRIWSGVISAAALHVIQVDARLAQAGPLDLAPLVVADSADVLRAQAQPRARRHRAGHLSARTDDLFLERNLAGICRKTGDHKERVGSVQSYAGDVELGGHGTIVLWGGGVGLQYFEKRRTALHSVAFG